MYKLNLKLGLRGYYSVIGSSGLDTRLHCKHYNNMSRLICLPNSFFG